MNPSNVQFNAPIVIPTANAIAAKFPCANDQFTPIEGNESVTVYYETGNVVIGNNIGLIYQLDLTNFYNSNQLKMVRSVNADMIMFGMTNAVLTYLEFQPIADLLLLAPPMVAAAAAEMRSGSKEMIASASGLLVQLKVIGLASGSGFANGCIQLNFASYKRTQFPGNNG